MGFKKRQTKTENTNLEDLFLANDGIEDFWRPADFQERPTDVGMMFIPQRIYDLAIDAKIHLASDLYAATIYHPTHFTTRLGWTYDELAGASDKLRESLRGYVDDNLLPVADASRHTNYGSGIPKTGVFEWRKD